MSRKRHIDTRNLIVCETFDEFAEKVRHLDPNVEDIVGYVTSVSRVFYWLNVESVWGVLGFTWDSLETLEGAPYLEERLEHVEASGAIIDYSQKDAAWKLAHAVKKGYGHFNTTTMPFSILPKLPDGYRITGFVNTFDGIASDEIEVQKSDWSNFSTITNLVPLNKSLTIDLSGDSSSPGADITTVNGSLFQGNAGTVTNKSKLYIKADFSKIDSIGLRYGYQGSDYKEDSPYLIVDDNNKYLNLPKVTSPEYSTCVLYYKGTGPLKIEYFFKEIYSTTAQSHNGINTFDNSYSPILYSENSQYNITVDENNNYYVIARRPSEINTNYAEEEEPAIDITLGLELNGNIRMCSYLATSGNLNAYNRVYDYKLNVPKYNGTIQSIDWYNPYYYVYNTYPAFDANLYSKILDTEEGRFMPFAELLALNKCPYTIDLADRYYFNIFYFLRSKSYTLEYIESLSNAELFEDYNTRKWYVCDILPTFTNKDKTFEVIYFPTTALSSDSALTIYWKCPSIRTKTFVGNNFYLDENSKIECTILYGKKEINSNGSIYSNNTFNIWINDTENTHIRLIKDGGYYIFGVANGGVIHPKNINSTVNFIEFENVSYSVPSGKMFGKLSAIDIEFFKQSAVNTYLWDNNVSFTNFIQPFVLSNIYSANSGGFIHINDYKWNTTSAFNPSFIFIYKTNIFFSRASAGRMSWTPSIILDIIYHIEPLTESEDYEKWFVKFDRSILNTIPGTDTDTTTDRGAMINYVKNICHYDFAIDENN